MYLEVPVAHLSNRALRLFYNVFGKKVHLRRSPTSSSADLDYNLRQVGETRPSGTQAHHIIPGNDGRAAVAQDILARHEININSPINGVYIPGCGSSSVIGSVHCGSHTSDYIDEVVSRLIAADATGIMVAYRHRLRPSEVIAVRWNQGICASFK